MALLVYTAIRLNVTSNGLIIKFDRPIYQQLQSLRTPTIDTRMISFTEMGYTFVVVITTIALLIVLLVHIAWRTATF